MNQKHPNLINLIVRAEVAFSSDKGLRARLAVLPDAFGSCATLMNFRIDRDRWIWFARMAAPDFILEQIIWSAHDDKVGNWGVRICY